jgi:hypothetical protein
MENIWLLRKRFPIGSKTRFLRAGKVMTGKVVGHFYFGYLIKKNFAIVELDEKIGDIDCIFVYSHNMELV